jgi:hypothetical protein
LNMMAGTYTVRIELVAGGRTRLDYIAYNELPNSGIAPDRMEPSTWSRIKEFYR